jgi:hypothetical protein
MAYLITPANVWAMLKELGETEHANAMATNMELLLKQYASKVAVRLGIEAGKAAMDDDEMGGLLITMHPSSPGQPLPEIMRGMDSEECWGEELDALE